jgi:hypothetical protein
VPLDDVLGFRSATLEVDPGPLLPMLHGRAAEKGRKPGRPTARETVLDFFERRRRAGLILPQVGREAAAIAAELPLDGRSGARGAVAGTVENIIRERYRTSREAEPRSTK